jgi:ribosomal protein S14
MTGTDPLPQPHVPGSPRSRRVGQKAYRDCARRGLTQAETARELGVTREAVRTIAARHRIDFVPGKGSRMARKLREQSDG